MGADVLTLDDPPVQKPPIIGTVFRAYAQIYQHFMPFAFILALYLFYNPRYLFFLPGIPTEAYIHQIALFYETLGQSLVFTLICFYWLRSISKHEKSDLKTDAGIVLGFSVILLVLAFCFWLSAIPYVLLGSLVFSPFVFLGITTEIGSHPLSLAFYILTLLAFIYFCALALFTIVIRATSIVLRQPLEDHEIKLHASEDRFHYAKTVLIALVPYHLFFAIPENLYEFKNEFFVFFSEVFFVISLLACLGITATYYERIVKERGQLEV